MILPWSKSEMVLVIFYEACGIFRNHESYGIYNKSHEKIIHALQNDNLSSLYIQIVRNAAVASGARER